MTASPLMKNIVIVLDTSNSMAAPITIENNRTTRLEVAKDAVKSLLNTLTPDDQVCGTYNMSNSMHMNGISFGTGCAGTGSTLHRELEIQPKGTYTSYSACRPMHSYCWQLQQVSMWTRAPFTSPRIARDCTNATHPILSPNAMLILALAEAFFVHHPPHLSQTEV